MTFFDEVKRGLASTGKQVINKTRELTDTVQLKTLIAGEKENLLKLYAQIGRQIFDDDQAVDQTRFAREFEQIRKTLARKKMLEEQLSNVDGFETCGWINCCTNRNTVQTTTRLDRCQILFFIAKLIYICKYVREYT